MSENSQDDVRLSRGCDVVGFNDVADPETIFEVWQMHTVPMANELVMFGEETSLPEVAGVWQVLQRLWICEDSPVTVRLLVRRIRDDPTPFA
jgi:hypothetical protein